ncbi:type II secretion system protein J [Patescibacteria group bacterium]
MIGSKRQQSGFTIVELLVALGIFVTIAAITVGVFASTFRIQGRTYKVQNAAQQMRLLQDTLSRDIRENESIVCTADSIEVSDIDKVNYSKYTLDSADNRIHKTDDPNATDRGAVFVDLDIESFDIYCHDVASDGVPNLVTVVVDIDGIEEQYQMTINSRMATRWQ